MKLSRILKIFSRHGSLRGHFSQYGEDVILHKLFGNKFSDGFYIDVGAHHPFRQSNTAYLWLMGWHGVNVDASKKSIALFNSVRTDDVNLWAAVVDDETGAKQSEITLYSNTDIDLCATCNPDLARDRQTTRTEVVPCLSLTEIIKRHAPKDKPIDFLNIDIEGFDQAVIAGIGNWVSKPRVICMEIYADSMRAAVDSEASMLLDKNGYDMITRIGHSAIFRLRDR